MRLRDSSPSRTPHPDPLPSEGRWDKQSVRRAFPASFAPWRGEGLRMRGGRRMGDHVLKKPPLIQDADVMLPVTEIQAKGEPAADGSGRSGNDGRSSSFSFHKAELYHQTLHCARCLPSHLIWLGVMVISNRSSTHSSCSWAEYLRGHKCQSNRYHHLQASEPAEATKYDSCVCRQ